MTAGRVLMVVTGLGLGGAERQVVLLATGLRRRGWEVRVVSLTDGGPLAAGLEGSGIGLGSLGMRPGRPSLQALGALAREYRTFRPDVVHAHMVHAILAARLARLLVPVPLLVCTAHSVDEGGWVRELWYRATDRLAEVTTQVSHIGLERYVARGMIRGDRGRYMPNGLPVADFEVSAGRRPAARNALGLGAEFAWLCAARLEPVKGHATLLDAWVTCRGTGPDAVLLVAGDGALRRKLEQRTKELGVGESVRFLGPRSDMPDLLAAADGIVLASRWEGAPMVLLEAGAAGLPAVATAVGGVPELLERFAAARLVPPDDAASLAEAMSAMSVNGVRLREEAGSATREAVRRDFDLEGVVTAWETLYRTRE